MMIKLSQAAACRTASLGALSLALGGWLPAGAVAQSPAPAPADEARAAAEFDLITALEGVVSRAIARAEKSVVSIARLNRNPNEEVSRRDLFTDPFNPRATPSDVSFVPNEFAAGVVVDSSGMVLTNFHVVDDPRSDYFVTNSDQKTFRMRVKAGDGHSDLAVLEVLPELQPRVRPGDFVPIAFGDSSTLKKGQFVIALGNPYSVARDGQASASLGIVANLARKADALPESSDEPTLHHFGTLIQTDARLNLGTSGGALINLRGEMVGLTTALAATAGYEQAAGYAIPVDKMFLRVLETQKQGREVEYGLLGIRLGNVPLVDAELGMQGARVQQVSPGLPASRAGIRARDVITHVNGQPVRDADGLRLAVARLPPGTAATITVDREGRIGQVQVTLAKLPVNRRKVVTVESPRWRGMQIDYSTAAPPRWGIGPEFDIDRAGPQPQCVVVTDVREESPAVRAGLKQGDKITHVGTTAVESPDDFREAVASRKGPVALQIIAAGGSRRMVNVPPE